jgi:hypothetical protein
MMAVLMTAQLWELRWGTDECDRWGRILFDHAERQSKATGKPPVVAKESIINECTILEDEYRRTSDQFLSVILALLGGAGMAGGTAMVGRKRPEPDPPTEAPEPAAKAPETPPAAPADPAPPPSSPPRAESPLDRIRRQEGL